MKRTEAGEGGGFDLLVIGSGAAGMAAAIRAAELGWRAGIIEAADVGGTCVNVGCIPSKNLIAAAEHYHAARTGFPGVGGCDPTVDWPGVLAQKRELIASLQQSKYLDVLESYPTVKLLHGPARVVEPGLVEVDGTPHRTRKLVIATGTSPSPPPIPGIADAAVLDSTSAMEIDERPTSMIVLGGSAVGLELGQMFARFGTRVTVLELLPRILASEDAEASEELRRRLVSEGIEIVTGARASRIEAADRGVALAVATPGGERVFRAERLLAATGRRANTHGLGLERAGVQVDSQGFVKVDAGMRTSNPDIFAAGDVTGGPGFVYVAAAGGRVAAENALIDADRMLDLSAVPRITFTDPQLASVGLTHEEAHERGITAETVRLELSHLPRALVSHRTSGWMKLVAEAANGRLLGAHVVAPNGGELLGQATLAVRLGLSLQDVVDTLHPYLTWVEGLKLAAQAFTHDVSKLSCCA